MLELKNVTFSYEKNADTDRVFNFNLALKRGEITVVAGQSGIGKTTLLNLIAGFLSPLSGTMTWGGVDISKLPPSQRPLSMIFQGDNLFDHLTARQNIALGLKPSLRLSDVEWDAVDASMEKLGILPLKFRIPSEISGGQQQRVSLARTLIRAEWQERYLLLLDEPFSALDDETRGDCIRAIQQVAELKNMAVLLVSHHYREDASALGASVLFLDGK